MERAFQWGSLVVVAWTCVAALRAYGALPQRIPVHFDLFGRPDGWGPRWMIFLLPLISLFLLLLWSKIGSGSTSRPLEPGQRRGFYLLFLVIAVAFLYVNRQMIEISSGRVAALDKLFLPVFLLALGGAVLWMVLSGTP